MANGQRHSQGLTLRADIRMDIHVDILLDICKITDVRVKLSVYCHEYPQ